MFKQSKRKAGVLRRAFTITELVIVIAVIAILAAVLIPTFANVIENSKKSHDEQYEYEINVALAGYTNSHGAAPTDYEELMLALAEYDLCDTSNPFLLATALKQDNTYLVWYPSTNTVALINDNDYVIVPNTTVGLGNAVTVMPRQATGADTLLGYRLCNTGLPDSVTLANEYLTIYEEYNGNLVAYVQGEGAEHIQQIADSMQNAGWGNAFIGSMNNAQQGYIYNETTANDIREQAQTSSSITIPIDVPADYATASDEEKTVVEQSIRSGLATIATLSNSDDTAALLENKTISFEAEGGDADTALEGVVVDMSGAQINSIGTTYRKAYDGSKVNSGIEKVETGTVSVNFGGVELSGMNVTANSLIASGAEYQDEGDNGYPGGSYAFTYGLFGTVHADEGDTVTISNLKISNVDANLTGATQMVNGQSVVAVSDMAGIVVGYTQGNVVLENIEINGASVEGRQGLFEGYDGVAALVGRAYSNQSAGYTEHLTLRNCTVSNLQINGQRRAAGFVSYAGRGIIVDIENCTMDNVSILSRRNDDKVKDMYVGVFGHFASGTELNVDGVTLTDVTCTANVTNGSSTTPIQNIMKGDTPFLDYAFYLKSGNSYLPLVYTDGKIDGATTCAEVNFGETGLTLTFAGATYKLSNDTLEFGAGKTADITGVFTKS